jgi:hypothetical protein
MAMGSARGTHEAEEKFIQILRVNSEEEAEV